MRRRRIALLAAFASLLAGCSFLRYGAENAVTIPIQKTDLCALNHQNRRLARQAWATVEHENPDGGYSDDYADGFMDGYADYLDAGGTGLPPAVPPFRYRLSRYMNPEGRVAIENWFAGFSQGAATAQASGLRQLRVIPTSAPGLPQPYPVFHPGSSESSGLPLGGEVPELPFPRLSQAPRATSREAKSPDADWQLHGTSAGVPAQAQAPSERPLPAGPTLEKNESVGQSIEQVLGE